MSRSGWFLIILKRIVFITVFCVICVSCVLVRHSPVVYFYALFTSSCTRTATTQADLEHCFLFFTSEAINPEEASGWKFAPNKQIAENERLIRYYYLFRHIDIPLDVLYDEKDNVLWTFPEYE